MKISEIKKHLETTEPVNFQLPTGDLVPSHFHVAEGNMKKLMLKYKKPIIITVSIIILQLIWGFDPKFCIINLIWLLV